VYGLLNRLLLVTGLHHILNSLVWFVFGTFSPANGGAAVTGDLHRFFAGDPTAGSFMAGFFPVMMFGLPAACLAMLHEAPKERRAMVAGLLMSMALTSFLTGVTEPIEFTFMFLAPVLYAIHAVLTGLSLAICSLLGIKLGFTFSAGFIDYVLNFGLSTHGWYAIPLGVAYAVVYYALFRFFIRRFNLPTPGREGSAGDTAIASSMSGVAAPGGSFSRAGRYIDALGGAANLKVVDACTTRLRLSVVDPAHVSEPALKAIGARGVLKRGGESVQVIIGPEADIIADEIRSEIARGGASAVKAAPVALAGQAADVTTPAATAASVAGPLDPNPSRWLAVLGGVSNIVSLDAVAATRLRVIVRDPAVVDREKLGALDVAWVSADTLHIVVGDAAARYARELALQPA
jgi:PTS system N-acetylglucosamine-specific IIC component